MLKLMLSLVPGGPPPMGAVSPSRLKIKCRSNSEALAIQQTLLSHGFMTRSQSFVPYRSRTLFIFIRNYDQLYLTHGQWRSLPSGVDFLALFSAPPSAFDHLIAYPTASIEWNSSFDEINALVKHYLNMLEKIDDHGQTEVFIPLARIVRNSSPAFHLGLVLFISAALALFAFFLPKWIF